MAKKPNAAKPEDKEPTMTPESVGAALSNGEQTVPAQDEEAEDDVTEDISAELSKAEEVAAKPEDGGMRAQESQGFDLRNLSEDQLSQLKSLLENASPAKAKKATITPTVEIREFDGKVVVDFGRAFPKLVRDHESQSDKPKTHINFKVEGSDTDILMLYKEFMNLPRVTCQQVSVEVEDVEREVGETYSKELKRKVPMYVNFTKRVLTLKKPDGSTFIINATKVN